MRYFSLLPLIAAAVSLFLPLRVCGENSPAPSPSPGTAYGIKGTPTPAKDSPEGADEARTVTERGSVEKEQSLIEATPATISTILLPAEEEKFSMDQEPWNGKEESFVKDMLKRWRDDYSRLSTGELRLKMRDVIVGVSGDGARYSIETLKKGSITFENDGGIIRCTIRKK